MDYSNQSVLGILLAFIGAYAAFVLVFTVLIVIGNWRIYTKAGEAGWKSLIPIYSDFVAFKLFWKPMFFWIGLGAGVLAAVLSFVAGTMDPQSAVFVVLNLISSLVGLVSGILAIIRLHKMSCCFGHGVGFTLGLIFLNPIFLLILGFGSSTYLGNPDAE